MKKLFTIFGMICVALTSWGQPKHVVADWDSNTKTLTLDFTDVKGPELENWKTEVTNKYSNLNGNVENLIISGNFSNKEFLEKITDKLSEFGNSMNVNMSGCTGVMAKYLDFSEFGGANGLQTETIYTTFKVDYPGGYDKPENVTMSEIFLYKGQILDPSQVTEDENHRYWTTVWEASGNTPGHIKDAFKAGGYTGYNNGQPVGANGSWNADHTVYTCYEWYNNENSHGAECTFTKTTDIVEIIDAWTYSETVNGQTSLVMVEADEVTEKTNGDNIGSTGKYTHKVNQEVFHLGNLASHVKSFVCPDNENFTFIAASATLFASNTKLESVILSDKIKAIDKAAFMNCTALTTIKYPESQVETGADFPASLEQIGGDAFNTCSSLTAAYLAGTKLDRVRYHTFNDCINLAEVTFPAATLETIQTQAFQRTAIVDLNLSECHKLTLIGQKAFENVQTLQSVTVCSHPKVIKGDEGSGAFNNCTNIKTVEVVGCMDAPDLTRCICENRAFAPEITYVQTQVANVETKGARLIFPQADFWNNQMKEAGNNKYNYADAFDYFVGNYKEGVALSVQSNILAYFNIAPTGAIGAAVEDVTGTITDAYCASDKAMADDRGIGNGWHEFMNISEAIVIPPSESFLRTYSRTEGSGPIVLPFGITAYRAIDYVSTPEQIVKDRYNGDLYFIGDPNNPDDVADPDKYQPKEYFDNNKLPLPKGKPQYKYATVGGTLYLRPLHPVKKSDGSVNDKLSYVPEETGVVLYSETLGENAAFLIFKEYKETADTAQYVLRKYPHTETSYERKRVKENGEDVINMLQGSYGRDYGVGPVYPWNYADQETFTGGTYDPTDIQYRQFGLRKSANKWIRLQPGRMKYNRAFAKIPAGLFNNPNEREDQMPDFNKDPWSATDSAVGQEGSSNTFFVFGSTFEDEVADGIMTITTPRTYESDAWYTLQGVKVAKPAKGVYIHNNKKVVIK